MKIAFEIDHDNAAGALIIRRLDPTDLRSLLEPPDEFCFTGGWERAIDALSPELPPPPPRLAKSGRVENHV